MKYTDKQKKKAVRAWFKNLGSSKPKSMVAYCAKYDYSPRSLSRWVGESSSFKVRRTGETMHAVDSINQSISEPEVEIYGTSSKITLYRDRESLVVSKESSPELYGEIIDLYKNEKYQEAWLKADVKTKIKTLTHGRVSFNEGQVSVDGWDVKGSFINHMVIAANDADEEKLVSWCKFVDKLINLSDQTIVEEIADFMSVNSIEIDSDGDIIGYRGVKPDYWDVYTGKTFLSTVGSTISMPRHLCDSNRDMHCSTGAHFGSLEYASGHGSKVMKVKVNPSDVTSIPSDCNFHKARCCKMLIVEEL